MPAGLGTKNDEGWEGRWGSGGYGDRRRTKSEDEE